jgi:hypothetical protein
MSCSASWKPGTFGIIPHSDSKCGLHIALQSDSIPKILVAILPLHTTTCAVSSSSGDHNFSPTPSSTLFSISRHHTVLPSATLLLVLVRAGAVVHVVAKGLGLAFRHVLSAAQNVVVLGILVLAEGGPGGSIDTGIGGAGPG